MTIRGSGGGGGGGGNGSPRGAAAAAAGRDAARGDGPTVLAPRPAHPVGRSGRGRRCIPLEERARRTGRCCCRRRLRSLLPQPPRVQVGRHGVGYDRRCRLRAGGSAAGLVARGDVDLPEPLLQPAALLLLLLLVPVLLVLLLLLLQLGWQRHRACGGLDAAVFSRLLCCCRPGSQQLFRSYGTFRPASRGRVWGHTMGPVMGDHPFRCSIFVPSSSQSSLTRLPAENAAAASQQSRKNEKRSTGRQAVRRGRLKLWAREIYSGRRDGAMAERRHHQPVRSPAEQARKARVNSVERAVCGSV